MHLVGLSASAELLVILSECTYSNQLQPAPKPIVTSCLFLPPEIVMHDAYIGRCSENNIKCVVVHNDLGRNNRKTLYILPRHWLYE